MRIKDFKMNDKNETKIDKKTKILFFLTIRH